LAIRTASKSGWMTPFEGDAFLTSAIRPGRPEAAARARMAARKSRAGAAALTATPSAASGSLFRIASTSRALYHTISSSMLRGVLSSRPGTL